ncbi:DeoR/GlpR family DNA-binding transcription regulator [Klebsiella pneumoniae]
MFAEERQEKLLGILREKRKVAVSEMCDVFNVSGATIRADLRQLEEEGLLTRTHGGAVLRTRASFEQASDDREIVNLSAKERIGQRAAALVEDGDIIVLDTGTTTLHIARNIRDRQNVTVVTNDYQIARELEASASIQTILLGGIVKKGYHFLPYSAAFTCMKGMTVIVLMWEEAAIKDDVIEYDIEFNIIYIMRTNIAVAKLRCPSLTK